MAETTERVVGERRLDTLRELGLRTAAAAAGDPVRLDGLRSPPANCLPASAPT